MKVIIKRHIDLDTKLNAACAYDFKATNVILHHYIEWENENGNKAYSLTRQDYLSIFDFEKKDILNYLQNHPETCNRLLQQSYDKRYSPSTFIEEHEGKFRVGWFDKDREDIRVFENIVDAASDYVLFSWEIGRL